MTPFLLAALLPILPTVLALVAGRIEASWPSPRLPGAAGPWIEGVIRERGLPIGVELVPADTPDAYWPNARSLALSERTYAGVAPRDWAIAAHELGHALNTQAHPSFHALLPGARLLSALSWRVCLAALFTAALLGETIVLPIGLAALIGSVAMSAVVCVDELAASWRGRALMAEDADRGIVRRASVAMGLAAGAYVAGAVGQVVLLGAWPWFAAAAMVDADFVVKAPSHLGIWLFVAMVPIVAVRTAIALQQALAPERVPSEFDLFAMLARESHWESLCALVLFAVVSVLHASLAGPDLAVATMFAVAAALGQVYAVVAALVSLPGVVWRRLVGEPARVRYPFPARDDIPRAMMAMFDDPPWYLRAMWLTPLGYVPFVALLASRFLA